MDIKRIDEVEFLQLKEEWNTLLGRSSADNVFLRWEWMYTWWEIFKKQRTLFILTVRHEGRLVGVAPFYIEPAIFPMPRRLRFCSEELSPDYMDIIAERGQEAGVLSGIVKFIRQCGREWDVIALDNLLEGSLLLSDLSLFSDYAVVKEATHVCPYVKITGSFDEYYKARPELVSFKLVKKLNKLRDQMNVVHRIIRDEDVLSKGIDDLFDLHEKRAGDKHMHSSFLSADIKRFHQDVSRLFLKEGLLNFHFLYSGDTPVTARYGFIYKNKAYCYQNGFDPEWKKWSVGAVLTLLVIEQAFKDRLDEFDFLKGAESYKSLWSNGVREEMLLIIFNGSLRGSLCRKMADLKSALRSAKHVVLHPSMRGPHPPA
ncbi:MAG: GNAT family N-acetyltransferase [Elusimicrobiota bacterium]|jgi:CelD/BcsL family acetyltransferase involved in cellulose biosynthesis